MTEQQATREIERLYFDFVALQARDTLRRTEARLKALPELVLFPEVKAARVPDRKRLAVASVLDLLHNQRPELPRAPVHWFVDADSKDLELRAKYEKQGSVYPFEALYGDGLLLGLCDYETGRIWIKAGLDGAQLIEVAAHEAYHHLHKSGSEADAKAFGLKAANILAPMGGLLFAEQHEHLARPGDSILRTYGDRKWIRDLHRDGSLRPLQPYELFVASGPIYQ